MRKILVGCCWECPYQEEDWAGQKFCGESSLYFTIYDEEANGFPKSCPLEECTDG